MSEGRPERANLARMRALMNGDAEPPPIAKLIGFRPTAIEEGMATFEMEAREVHRNPMGTLHGGVLCDLGDAAMGFAMATTLDDGESFTTIELKVSYFKPVFSGRLRAVATMIKRSKTLGFLD